MTFTENKTLAETILQKLVDDGTIETFSVLRLATPGKSKSKRLDIWIGLCHENTLFDQICAKHATVNGKTNWSFAHQEYDDVLRDLRKEPIIATRLAFDRTNLPNSYVLKSGYINRTPKLIEVDSGVALNTGIFQTGSL